MKQQVMFSVVVPVYNDQVRLQECLKSLKSQTFKGFYEVLVVDNGSDQDIKSVTDQFPEIIYLTEDKPGSYAARNKGIDYTTGNYIAFTDSDCIPSEDWLENALNFFEQNEECTALGGEIELFPNSDHPNGFELFDMLSGFKQDLSVNKWGYSVTANLIVRKEAIEKSGKFDDSLKSGGDVEWSKRHIRTGGNLQYSSNVIVKHPALSSYKQFFNKYSRIAGGMYERDGMGLKDIVKFSYQRLRNSVKCYRELSKSLHDLGLIKRQKVALIPFLKTFIYSYTLLYLCSGGKQKR